MRKLIVKKRGILFLLILMMLLGAFISNEKALAAGKKVDVSITDLSITNSSGEVPPGGYSVYMLFKLSIKWNASKHGNTLREGDYFELELPDKFKYPEGSAYCDFNLHAGNGEVSAKVKVEPKVAGGGKLRVTFTDYVNNKHNFKGSLNLLASWNITTYPIEQEEEHDIAIGWFHKSINIKPGVPSPPEERILNKYAGQTLTSDGYVNWYILINMKRANLKNVVVKDTLTVEPPGSPDGIHYRDGSFILCEYELVNGKWVKKKCYNVNDRIEFSSDKRSFTFRMGNLDGKAYRLHYQSTYREGLKLKNRAELTSTEVIKEVSSSFVTAQGGGAGDGELPPPPPKIKVDVTKVWEDNNNHDNKRPGEIKVRLFADDMDTGKVLTLSDVNSWKGSFIDLDKYKPGGEIKYTVKEDSVIDGYIGTITGDYKTGFVITNKRIPPNKPDPKDPPNPADPPDPTNPPSTPQTGDKANLSLFIGMLIVSGIFLLTIIIHKIKNKKINN